MKARILQARPPQNQSAPFGKGTWKIEIEPKSRAQYIDKLTGWLSSNDMSNQIKLSFNTLAEAEKFASIHNIDYEVILPKKKKTLGVTYADNFK